MRIDPTPPSGRADRVALGRPATMRDPTRAPFDVLVENLSETGALLLAEARLPVGSLVSLGLAGIGMQIARVTREDPRGIAIEFMTRLDPQEVARATVARGATTVAIPQMLVAREPDAAVRDRAPIAADGAPAPDGAIRQLPVTPLPGPGELVQTLLYRAGGTVDPAAPPREDRLAPDARALWFAPPQPGRPSRPGRGTWLIAALGLAAALVWLLV